MSLPMLPEETRAKALAWWEGLSPEQKQAYWEGYSAYSPSVNYSQLTGREVQNIWAVQTNTNGTSN